MNLSSLPRSAGCCTLEAVDNSCHKCGGELKEGTAFCPECGAPQIRVGVLNGEHEGATPAPQEDIYRDGYGAGPRRPGQVDWLHASLPSVAWGGVIATLLMVATHGAFALGVLVGGFVTIVFYRRRNPLTHLKSGLGARLGAAAGAITYGILLLLLAISVTVFHGGGQLRQALDQAIQNAVARASDPQVQQALQSFQTAQGRTILLVVALIFMLVLLVAIASVGGVLGAFLLRDKRGDAQRKNAEKDAHSEHSGTEDHQNSFK
jgi:hypothetical protein